METVKYLFPAPEEHGHWVQAEEERPRVTKYLLWKAKEPITDQKWVAIEKEAADALTTRRRLREKTSVRKIEVEETDLKDEEKEEEKVQQLRQRLSRMIEEEMKHMVEDDPDIAVAKMKRMMEEPSEEDEILQTKVISTREVAKSWKSWLEAIDAEVHSLLEEKEALKKIARKELEEIQKKAAQEGRTVEIIPSKLVFTIKAGPNGGKRKTRWVICGNYESKKDSEQTFSSGADVAAFWLWIWAAARHQWAGAVIDIKTAFLNALMDQDDQEAVLIVRPPALFTEKGYMAPDDFFVPQRAVYGLRRSPRLWGTCRDETMESFQIEAEDSRGRKRKFHLRALQSEPNLWRVLEIFDESQVLWGLVMTYLDDIFICSSHSILEAIKEKCQETWKTSTPEYVSEHPIRFLGMEVSKRKAEDGEKEEWYVTQRSYIKDLIEKNEEKVKERKIPVTRDQAHIEAPASTPTLEEVPGAQKCVGEVLWLLTRSRPDLMYGVSRMGSNVLKNPVKVMELGDQMKGYLKRTPMRDSATRWTSKMRSSCRHTQMPHFLLTAQKVMEAF